MLKSSGLVQLKIIDLDTMGEPRNGPVQQELNKITGVMSVPQVFVKGKFFGDNSQMKAHGAGLKQALLSAGAAFEQ